MVRYIMRGVRMLLRSLGAFLQVIAACALAACWAGGDGDAPAPGAPRIVSNSAFGTRLVLALDAGPWLAATSASARPAGDASAIALVEDGDVAAHAPTLVLEHADTRETAKSAAPHTTIAIAPHSPTDVYELMERIGAALGVEQNARRWVQERADPLARLSAGFGTRARPTVVPIASLDPLVLAGGHSTASELIEVAGAESATHDADVARIAIAEAALSGYVADAVIAMLPRPLDPEERARLEALAPGGARVLELPLVETEVWLGHPIETACRLAIRLHGVEGVPAPCGP